MAEFASQAGSDVIINVMIVPGSSKTAIAGLLGDKLKIKVAAPPEKGKANENLIAFLADILSVKKSDITVISGLTNPIKQLRIRSALMEQVRLKLKIKDGK